MRSHVPTQDATVPGPSSPALGPALVSRPWSTMTALVFTSAMIWNIACGPAWHPCFSSCDAAAAAVDIADSSRPAVVVDMTPDQEWQDSRLTVRKGDRLLISATGEVSWQGQPTTRPDGDGGRPGWNVGRGGLIAKVGVDGKTFDVGARTELFPDTHARPPHHPHPPPALAMDRDGPLYLGFKNFSAGQNSGGYHVTIRMAVSRTN